MLLADEKDLWERVSNFSLDDPESTFSFSTRLASENSWSYIYTQRVIVEYKRFVFLAMVAGHPVTPSINVDEAWHLHLCYTKSYWDDLCGKVLKRPLHHNPTKGGFEEQSKFYDQYNKTLDSYERFFAQKPSQDIWPPAKRRFAKTSLSKQVNPSPETINGFDKWLACVVSIIILVIFGGGTSFLTGLLLKNIFGGWTILWGFLILLLFSTFAAQYINSNIDWARRNKLNKHNNGAQLEVVEVLVALFGGVIVGMVIVVGMVGVVVVVVAVVGVVVVARRRKGQLDVVELIKAGVDVKLVQSYIERCANDLAPLFSEAQSE